MPRFVMANRRAGKFEAQEKIRSRESLTNVMNSSFMTGASVTTVNEPAQETARTVVRFEANEAEVAAKREALPSDIIIEPEILHFNDSIRPIELASLARDALDGPIAFGRTETLDLTIQGNGSPLNGADVILYLRAGRITRSAKKTTGQNGRVRFTFSETLNVTEIHVFPAGNFWSMLIRGPRNDDIIECPALPAAIRNLGWWHERMGISRYNKTRGRGIKVGVADTGLGVHGDIEHVTDIGTFVGELTQPEEGADVDPHGSHVCGIIGARPASKDRFAGIAPGVSLYSARVFPPNGKANQGDIANAIDALSEDYEADLINLSLGAPRGSEIVHDAIIIAAERGTLCVCAAANSNGPVEFPAAFPETLAISAIGLIGWGSVGSTASYRQPQEFERFGSENLYHANFSCFGPEITGGAPGVGIISTVPERYGFNEPYAAMGGTSMASPAACGALAAVLANDKNYKSLPRDELRTDRARTLFRQSCRDIGLDRQYQGLGMPQVS